MNNVFGYLFRLSSVHYIFQHELTLITTPPHRKNFFIRSCYLLSTFFNKLNNDWEKNSLFFYF